MNYDVKPTPTFIRQLEAIIGKYPETKEYLLEYLMILETDGIKGNRIPGNNFFWKDRFPIKGRRGKSGGGRIICYQNPENPSIIIPAMIYLKFDLSHPTEKMFKELLNEIQSL